MLNFQLCVERVGTGKKVISKGVLSLEESLESLNTLDSLESLESGRILLCFPQSGGSLESLKSLDFSEKTPFPKDPFSRTRKGNDFKSICSSVDLVVAFFTTLREHDFIGQFYRVSKLVHLSYVSLACPDPLNHSALLQALHK